MSNVVELGQHLIKLREQAGFKQHELAKRVTWSPAVLSRIESGERPLSSEELRDLLKAIGTSEAKSLEGIISREWRTIPTPPIDHQDQDLLWEAEEAVEQLKALRESDEIKHAFQRRLDEYIGEITQTARWLLGREHAVALIGSIGAGKSTAICQLTGLKIQGDSGAPDLPLLEVGGGGVTICEVHLRQGPGYGIIVEPRSEEELRKDVADFADFFLKKADGKDGVEQNSAGESAGISKEISRAVRNMAKLGTRKDMTADGKAVRIDLAKELAASFEESRTFAVEILARMELHRRDRRDIWHSASDGKNPLEWLKRTFEMINNGRHPEFSLPRRMEVIVPDEILGCSSLALRIIDTRGIDQTAERADLEGHFDDPNTVTILCTGFNDAPESAIQHLLKRALEAGVRGISTKAAILVLPRAGEALSVKDDDEGLFAQSIVEGYELKGEQVRMRLEHLGLGEMKVHFYNAREDDEKEGRSFVEALVESLRESYRVHLKEVIAGTSTLLSNYEKAQVQEIQKVAAKRLCTWLDNNKDIAPVSYELYDSLLGALGTAHAATIRASVRREGAWANLQYSHHLGYGARRVANASVGPKAEQFRAIADNLLQDEELVDAHDLVLQAKRLMDTSIDELNRKLQILGQTIYTNELREDHSFWLGCENEWGRGQGYRDRISAHNKSWFHKSVEAQRKHVRSLIQTEWNQVIARISSLVAIDA